MLEEDNDNKIKRKHTKEFRVLALFIALLILLGFSYVYSKKQIKKISVASKNLNEKADLKKQVSDVDLLKANKIDPKSIVPDKSGNVTRGVIVPLYDKDNLFKGDERVAADEEHKKDGLTSVKLTKLGSDNGEFLFERKITLGFQNSDTVGFWLYKDDSYNLGADSEVDIFLNSYNSKYNYFKTKIGGTDLINGWNFIKLKKKDFSAMGSALWQKIDTIKVSVKSKSKDNVSISISSLEVNNSMKPTVILCIDGNEKEISSTVLPLIKKYNFKITNFLNPSSVVNEKDVEKDVSVIADSNGNPIKDANGKSIKSSSAEGKQMIEAQKQKIKAARTNHTALDQSQLIKVINEKQKDTKVSFNIDTNTYNQYIGEGVCEIGLRSDDEISNDILNDYNQQLNLLGEKENELFKTGLNINNTVTSYAFSSNSYNDVNGKALKDSQFSFVRNGREGLINYFNVNNKNVVPSVMLNDSNVDVVKSYIDKTIEYNSAICLYTNNVLENNTNGYVNVSNANYEAVLQYLKTKCDSCQLQVVCVSDFVNENK